MGGYLGRVSPPSICSVISQSMRPSSEAIIWQIVYGLILLYSKLILIVGNIFWFSDSLARNIAQLDTSIDRLARVYAALLELHNDIHRSDALNVASEVCADAEGNLYATGEVLLNLCSSLKIKAIREDNGLTARVYAVGLILADNLIAKLQRVAAIVAHAIVEFCQLHIRG